MGKPGKDGRPGEVGEPVRLLQRMCIGLVIDDEHKDNTLWRRKVIQIY